LQAHAEAADRKADGEDPYAKNGLYPLMNAPVESGTLPVDSRHTIAYTVWGNRKGKPVLFVHGGPGGGTNPDQARFFDPEKYCIVLVDQRGCGKSTPFADLVDNTTWDSVRDFEKLRKKLGIDKWQVFGGSWGSTLALCYAIKHPERVSELVLRGIFLLRKKEIDWFYRSPGGVGAGSIFPAEWAVYESAIPPEERGDYVAVRISSHVSSFSSLSHCRHLRTCATCTRSPTLFSCLSRIHYLIL
jgi:proline iminopeptidase